MDGREEAFETAVVLGVILAAEADERFCSQLVQRDGFQPGEGMRRRHRYAQRVGPQQFKPDACGLVADGLADHDGEVQCGVLKICEGLNGGYGLVMYVT